MTVEVTGIFESAVRPTLCKVVQQSTLLGLVAVDFETEDSKPGIIQSTADDFEGGKLLRNEEYGLTPGECRGDEVRDGLGLARSGWTLDNQIVPTKRMDKCTVLRTISISDEVRDLLLEFGRIDGIFFS
jgi:hypothetical protein